MICPLKDVVDGVRNKTRATYLQATSINEVCHCVMATFESYSRGMSSKHGKIRLDLFFQIFPEFQIKTSPDSDNSTKVADHNR